MRHHYHVSELMRMGGRGVFRTAAICLLLLVLGVYNFRPDLLEWGLEKVRELAPATGSGQALVDRLEAGAQGRMAASAPVAVAPFPVTGDVRWFINPETVPPNSKALLKIIGSNVAGRNTTVKLEDWSTKALLAFIPIRSGETAQVQVPFGQYRVFFAQTSHPLALVEFGRSAHEALQPLEFGIQGKNVVGHILDFNTRIGGNLHTKPASSNVMQGRER